MDRNPHLASIPCIACGTIFGIAYSLGWSIFLRKAGILDPHWLHIAFAALIGAILGVQLGISLSKKRQRDTIHQVKPPASNDDGPPEST